MRLASLRDDWACGVGVAAGLLVWTGRCGGLCICTTGCGVIVGAMIVDGSSGEEPLRVRMPPLFFRRLGSMMWYDSRGL